VIIVLIVLGHMLVTIAVNGSKALNIDFFTQAQKPFGDPGGGVANAILGSLIVVGLATVLSLPISILAALYLAENAQKGLRSSCSYLSTRYKEFHQLLLV